MLNFLVLGDWGRGGTPAQHRVAAGMARVAREMKACFVVTTGDNFYEDGVTDVADAHWRRSFEDVYTAASLQTAWYATLGNHDYRGSVEAQIDYSARSSRWCMPERYYAMEAPIDNSTTALFVFIDTSPLLLRYRQDGSESMANITCQNPATQLAWLQSTLALSNAQWKFVVGHHPIYSGSPFHGATAELQHHLLPILQAQSVHAYFCGHEHDLQYLIAQDIHYIVSGSGSECRNTGVCEFSRFSQSSLGFTAVSLAAEQMQLGFYNADGQRIYCSTFTPSRRVLTSVETA